MQLRTRGDRNSAKGKICRSESDNSVMLSLRIKCAAQEKEAEEPVMNFD
jgi:hypothetical protein